MQGEEGKYRYNKKQHYMAQRKYRTNNLSQQRYEWKPHKEFLAWKQLCVCVRKRHSRTEHSSATNKRKMLRRNLITPFCLFDIRHRAFTSASLFWLRRNRKRLFNSISQKHSSRGIQAIRAVFYVAHARHRADASHTTVFPFRRGHCYITETAPSSLRHFAIEICIREKIICIILLDVHER